MTVPHDRTYIIDEVVSSSVVKDTEYGQLFPRPPEIKYHPVYKYESKIGKSRACLTFDR